MEPKFPMRNTTLCYLEQDDAYLKYFLIRLLPIWLHE